MSEENKERRRFPFLEAYYETAMVLDQESRAAFLLAVIEFGLYKQPPNFSKEKNKVACEVAWHVVEKWLDRSWTYRENGLRGGAPKGNQNARKEGKKKQPKTSNTNQVIEEKKE